MNPGGAQMSFHLVVGAGPVARETARLLAADGHDVLVTSRSAGSLDLGPVRTVSADATNAAELARIGQAAEVIFMCAMAAYHRWPTDFFPILDGTVKAAESVGARLIIIGNHYGYGAHAANPLVPTVQLDPTTRKGTVRAIMWERALRSDAPAIEIRASDYLGRDAIAHFSLLALPALREGKEIAFPGDHDAAHAWCFTKDTARTAVAASRYRGEWRRAFHVPSQTASVRELVQKFAVALHVDVPALRRLSAAELESLGFHELIEIGYLFDKPCLVDATDTERLLKVEASPIETMIEDTIAALP
jgi:nucleoside-diphosphate-sugar epimerase